MTPTHLIPHEGAISGIALGACTTETKGTSVLTAGLIVGELSPPTVSGDAAIVGGVDDLCYHSG